MSSALHPLLQPISWLEGTWLTSSGQGQFPNIAPFSYGERLQFKCVGQPMFEFSSDSWNLESGKPMHKERGFLRIQTPSPSVSLSMMVAHNFGVTSIEEGVYSDGVISLKSVQLSRMTGAKDPAVLKLERTYRLLEDGSLELVIFMETANTPLTEHLKAVYTKET